MDMLMQAQSIVEGVPSSWDIYLKAGLSQPLYGAEEQKQKAVIAAFLELGTIPGMETTGIAWSDYLTGLVNPREIDAQVRAAITAFTDSTDFVPYYYIKNGKLQLSIQEATNGN